VFSTYIRNFCPASSDTYGVKYADDLTLIVPFRAKADVFIQERIQSQVFNASNWCEENGFLLNKAKSKCMLIFRGSPEVDLHLDVEKVSSLKLLGVHFNKLNWNDHIHYF
jgi:hypothetical protein